MDLKRRNSLGPIRDLYRQVQRCVFYIYWALTTVLFGPVYRQLVRSLHCRDGVLTLERTDQPDEVVPCYTGKHLFIMALSAAIFIYPAVVMRSGRCGGDIAKICGPKFFAVGTDKVRSNLAAGSKFMGHLHTYHHLMQSLCAGEFRISACAVDEEPSSSNQPHTCSNVHRVTDSRTNAFVA